MRLVGLKLFSKLARSTTNLSLSLNNSRPLCTSTSVFSQPETSEPAGRETSRVAAPSGAEVTLESIGAGLGEVFSRLDILKKGQEALKQGQEGIEKEVKALKQGQEALNQGQEGIEKEVKALKQGQEALKQGQEGIEKEVKALKKGQAALGSSLGRQNEANCRRAMRQAGVWSQICCKSLDLVSAQRASNHLENCLGVKPSVVRSNWLKVLLDKVSKVHQAEESSEVVSTT